MTKIYAFTVRDMDVPFFEKWSADHNVEITLDPDFLSMDNVEKLKGYDGLTTMQYEPLEDEVYDTLAEYGIKQIAVRSAGFNQFNLEKANENNLIITNVPAYSPESIAEFTVAQALNAARNLYSIHDRIQSHDFSESLDIRGRRIGTMTVAIIGTGHIGQVTAKIFKGFGANIVAYDLYPNESLEGDLLHYAGSIEEAVSQADIVSLHVPLTDDNHHLIDADMFAKFKDNAILVNAGRGGLVDTEALLDALDNGKVAKAALDVYENELDYVQQDYSDKTIEDDTLRRLIEHPDVNWTPHLAYYTDESVQNMVYHALDATLEVLETGDSSKRIN